MEENSIHELVLNKDSSIVPFPVDQNDTINWYDTNVSSNSLDVAILSLPLITKKIVAVHNQTITKALNLLVGDCFFDERGDTSEFEVKHINGVGLEIKKQNECIVKLVDCNSIKHALTRPISVYFREKTTRRNSINTTEVACITDVKYKKKTGVFKILVKWILFAEYQKLTLVDNLSNDGDLPNTNASHNVHGNPHATNNLTDNNLNTGPVGDDSPNTNAFDNDHDEFGNNNDVVHDSFDHPSQLKIDPSPSPSPTSKKSARGMMKSLREGTDQEGIIVKRLKQNNQKDEDVLELLITNISKETIGCKMKTVNDSNTSPNIYYFIPPGTEMETTNQCTHCREMRGVTKQPRSLDCNMLTFECGYEIPMFERDLLTQIQKTFMNETGNELFEFYVKKVYRDGFILKHIINENEDRPTNFLSFRTLGLLNNKVFTLVQMEENNKGDIDPVDIDRFQFNTPFLVPIDNQTYVKTTAPSSKIFNIREEHLKCDSFHNVQKRFKDGEKSEKYHLDLIMCAFKRSTYIPRHKLACTRDEELGTFRMTVLQIFITTMTSLGLLDPYVAAVSIFGMHSIYLLISDLQQMSCYLSHGKIGKPKLDLKDSIWCKDEQNYCDLAKTTCKSIIDKMIVLPWFDHFCTDRDNKKFYRCIFLTFYNFLKTENEALFLELLDKKQGEENSKTVSGTSIAVCNGKVFRQYTEQAKNTGKTLFEVISQGTCIILEKDNKKFLTVCDDKTPEDKKTFYKSNFDVPLEEVSQFSEIKCDKISKRYTIQKTFSLELRNKKEKYRLMLSPAEGKTYGAVIEQFIRQIKEVSSLR